MLLNAYRCETPVMYEGMGSSAERWFDYATEMGGSTPELRDMTELCDFGRNRKFVGSSSPESAGGAGSLLELRGGDVPRGVHRAPTPLAGGRSRFRGSRFSRASYADGNESSSADDGGSPDGNSPTDSSQLSINGVPRRVSVRVERTFFDLIFKSASCERGLADISACLRSYPGLDIDTYMGAASLSFKRYCRGYFGRGEGSAACEPNNRQRIAIRRGFVVDTVLTLNLRDDEESSQYYYASEDPEYAEGCTLPPSEIEFASRGRSHATSRTLPSDSEAEPLPHRRCPAQPFPGPAVVAGEGDSRGSPLPACYRNPGQRRGHSAEHLMRFDGCAGWSDTDDAATEFSHFPMRYHSRSANKARAADQRQARSLSHSALRSPSYDILDQAGEWIQVQEAGGRVYFHNTATGVSQWDADGTPFMYEEYDGPAPPAYRDVSTTPPDTTTTTTTNSPSQFGDGEVEGLRKCDGVDVLPPLYGCGVPAEYVGGARCASGAPPPPPRGTSVARAASLRSRMSTDATVTHRSSCRTSMPPEECSFRDAAEARRPPSLRMTPMSGRPPIPLPTPHDHRVGKNQIYIKPLDLAICRHPLPWDNGSPYVYPPTYRSTTIDPSESYRTPVGLVFDDDVPSSYGGGSVLGASVPRVVAGCSARLTSRAIQHQQSAGEFTGAATPQDSGVRPGGYDTLSVDTDSFAELEREIDAQEQRQQQQQQRMDREGGTDAPDAPQPQRTSSSPEGTLGTTSAGITGGITDEDSDTDGASAATAPTADHPTRAARAGNAPHTLQCGARDDPVVACAPTLQHQPYAASPHAAPVSEPQAVPRPADDTAAAYWGHAGAAHSQRSDAAATLIGGFAGDYGSATFRDMVGAHCAEAFDPNTPHPPNTAPAGRRGSWPPVDEVRPQAAQSAPSVGDVAGAVGEAVSPPHTGRTADTTSSTGGSESEGEGEGEEFDEYETDASNAQRRLTPAALDMGVEAGAQRSSQGPSSEGRSSGARSQPRKDALEEGGDGEGGERRRRRRKKKKNPEKEKERKRQKKQRRRRLLRQQQYEMQLAERRTVSAERDAVDAADADTRAPPAPAPTTPTVADEHPLHVSPATGEGASGVVPEQASEEMAVRPVSDSDSDSSSDSDSDDWLFEMRARRGLAKVTQQQPHAQRTPQRVRRRFTQRAIDSSSEEEEDTAEEVPCAVAGASPGLPQHLEDGGVETVQHPFAEYGVGSDDDPVPPCGRRAPPRAPRTERRAARTHLASRGWGEADIVAASVEKAESSSDGEEELEDFGAQPPKKTPAHLASDGEGDSSRDAQTHPAAAKNVGRCAERPSRAPVSSFPPRNPTAMSKRGGKSSWGACGFPAPGATLAACRGGGGGGPTAVFSPPAAASYRSFGATTAASRTTGTAVDTSMSCSGTTPALASFDDPLSSIALVDDTPPLALEGPVAYPDFALRYAAPGLQGHYDIVMSSVRRNGESLEFASDALRNDKSVVMAAVKNNGKALRFASAELQNDPDVVLCAVENDHPNPHAAAQQLLASMGIVQGPSSTHLIRGMIGYLAAAEHDEEEGQPPLSITDRA